MDKALIDCKGIHINDIDIDVFIQQYLYGKEIKEGNSMLPYDVDKVYIQDKSVTVLLKNGKKGNSTCFENDVFDPYVGFVIAYYKAKQSKNFRLKQALKGCVANAKKKGYAQAILLNR